MNTKKKTLEYRKLTGQGYLKRYRNWDGSVSYYAGTIKITAEKFNEIRNNHDNKRSNS